MPHRDPDTGQFVPSESEQFDDIEVVSFSANIGITADDLSGGTGFGGGDSADFEGVQVIDYDEVVDRNEELHLLEASHRLTVYANSTETADGNVAGAVEISASPSRSQVVVRAVSPTQTEELEPGDAVGGSESDDSIDIVGRPLSTVGHAPFSDGASGTGGGGSSGRDSYDGDTFPAEYGRFHPRDELFVNGELVAWNVDDAGVHASISGQHIYGVMSD